jgi:hypothetical protein
MNSEEEAKKQEETVAEGQADQACDTDDCCSGDSCGACGGCK